MQQDQHIGMSDQPIVIGYYVLGGVSVLCSVFVVATLWFHGSLKTNATRLLLALHLSLICEDISALPYVYNTVDGLCEAVAFLHFYFGLASIVAIGFLVISYRYHFFTETVWMSSFIKKWAIPLVVIIPLVTLLPFASHSYDSHDSPWCAVSGKKNDHTWAFGVFYAWVWIILGSSTVSLIYTMVEIYNIDPTIGRKMFSTVGMYAIISIVTWIPRTTAQIINYRRGQLTTQQWLYSYIPLFAAGILYTMVFLTEKKALILFDRAVHTDAAIDVQNGRDRGMSGMSSFSWEGSDFRFTSTGRGMSILRNSWRQSGSGASQSGALRFSTATGSTGPIRNSMVTSGHHGASTDSSAISELSRPSLPHTSSSTTLELTRSPMSVNSTVSSLSNQTDDAGDEKL